ncbi:hypothetical protein NOU13_27425 [Rhodococcus erythropolis]|uniref:hypothetical protein n=1 Tax=Rhodococcus erythropolis TaxID=1833 RepID=UPI00210A10E9|nr:hypothetical protein [Rhodococcus erythropolis]MCQ4128240.1 hypothetical protein [Rhodococcus erythropolis]
MALTMHARSLTTAAIPALVGALLLSSPSAAQPLDSPGFGNSVSSFEFGSSSPSAHCPRSPLAPPIKFLDSDSLNATAMSLAEDPVVAAAKSKLRQTLTDSGLATDAATAAELPSYIDGLALAVASDVANIGRTSLAWDDQPDRRWGLDNPDVIYRSATIDENGSYLIRGTRHSSQNIYFQVLDAYPGDGTLGTTTGFLAGNSLVTASDGSFTLTLSADPGQPGENHITLGKGSKRIIVRDTLANWATDTPADLQLTQVDGPGVPQPTDAASEVARRMTLQGEFWANYVKQLLPVLPVNTVAAPSPTRGGLPGQVGAFAQFNLAPNEALVLTVDLADAPYFGMQLGNNWFTSMNYWDHQSSLNRSQVLPNPDGTATFVVSQQDPNVCNWIDPDGHNRGLIFLRWQDLPTDVIPAPVASKVITLDKLNETLTDVPKINQGLRQSQLEHRETTLHRRSATWPR